MKKLILTCTMIAIIAINAAAKTPTLIMNKDLIGSWNTKTSYVLDSITCYLKTENLSFYGNNYCIMQSTITNCSTEKSLKEVITMKWKKEGNVIVIYDNKDKIINYYLVKNNINTITNGQKLINDEKVINKMEEEKLFSCIM